MLPVILISAGAEWRAVLKFFENASPQPTPFGEWFETTVGQYKVILTHGGWGKVAAAASAQFAINHWQPDLMVNLGTCGGFMGRVERGEILLVDQTIIYDIVEQMNPDPQSAIKHYSTNLDLSWLAQPYPQPVRRSLLVSADRDICPEDIAMLVEKYNAIAADWESGAIAWVAARQSVRCLILRGVSDLVNEMGGEAYQGLEFFEAGANRVMTSLLENLPYWLDRVMD